jgi:hypothetical protein
MVELKAEDRPWAALEAEAERDDLRLGAPSCPPAFPASRHLQNISLILLLGLSSAAVLLCGCGTAARPGLQSSGDCHRVESERFALYSDPWVNLHHFLFEWARNVPERQPGDRRRAVDVPERAQIAQLDEGERQAWERALTLYRERWIARDLVEDEDLISFRGALASIACMAAGPERTPADARAALTDAMAVYRRHWWPGHHARNLKRINELLAGLSGHERFLAEGIAKAYGGRWPAARVRVDVSAYASWTGAYTTNHPDQITFSSTAYPDTPGLNILELLFHEVSHATFFEEPFLAELEAAFRARGAAVPDGLAHYLQFVTPAELLRSGLRGEELRGFRPYGERSGLYERSRTTAQRILLEKHWLPFLAGKVTRTEALDRIAAELAPHQTAVSH